MPEAPILELLTDIYGLMGAEVAAVWQVTPAGLHTLVWHSAESNVVPSLDARQHGIVTWTSEQAPGEVSSDGQPVCFVATPLLGTLSSHVLTVFSDRALGMGKEQYRHWLPRLAARLSTLAELVATRAVVTRIERQTTILLDAATRPHENRSVEMLGERMCAAALAMTETKRAALIHWNAAAGEGDVAYATRGHLISAGAAVSAKSQTGTACTGDFSVILDDARNRGEAFTVYGGTELPRSLGSLAIVPLRGCDGVIGAIVIEGDLPNQITTADSKNLRLLGLLAAAALETVWEIEEISRMARTDPLTGLANRQAFEERIRQLVRETDRFGGSGSLVVLDVDHFKHVNDTYGHHTGDVVLQKLAEMIRSFTRAVDLCARYGGEELALLLPQTGLLGASQLAERLRKRVAESPFQVDGRDIPITVSLGVASYPEGARNQEELFAAADRALYTAKRHGRNRVIMDRV